MWEADSRREVFSLKGQRTAVLSLVFSPDAQTFLTGNYREAMPLCRATDGEVLLTLRGLSKMVAALAFSPDGRLVASGSENRVYLWEVSTQGPLTLRKHRDTVSAAAFSPSGAQIASAGADQLVCLWDSATGQPLRDLIGHRGPVRAVAYKPDGRLLASAGEDGTVRLWDPDSGAERRRLAAHAGKAQAVAWSPDGRWLVSGGSDRRVKVWDAETGREVRSLDGHTEAVLSVAWEPGGRWLASSSWDHTARLWDAHTGALLHVLPGNTGELYQVAFDPAGDRLALAESGRVTLWDTVEGSRLLALRHDSSVTGLAWSPDGKRLACAGWDRTLTVWDPASGQETLSLPAHENHLSSVAWAPDGKRLLTAGQDRILRIWDARPRQEQPDSDREAMALLGFLFDRPLRRADVRAYVRGCPALTEQVRQKALALAERYQEEPDPRRYLAASWAVVRRPHLNATQYHFALCQARAAREMAAGQPELIALLGAAQYRAGQHADAVETLERANRARGLGPGGLAFLAMAHARAGKKKQAQDVLGRLRQKLRPAGARSRQDSALLREAEAVVEKGQR
jgi:WD40 repeat protein